MSIQSKKSASISSQANAPQGESSFDAKVSQRKKQPADLRKNVLSFNCTANFEHFKLLPADEEAHNKAEVAMTAIDETKPSNNAETVLSDKPCSDISLCKE